MAITYKLVEATTGEEVDLIYDQSVNQNYAMYTGSHSLDSPISPKFHKPDNAPPELISLIADIRPLFFRTLIRGLDSSGVNDPDHVLNNITTLARWIDGVDQQAARYHLEGDVNRIELHVAINGATNTTIFPVIYGNLNTFDSFFNEFGEDNAISFGSTVQLFLSPYGEGAAITLRNDLPSSPHMLQDSNADGLPDGWAEVNNPTTSLYTSRYVVGGQCMRVDTSASGQGVYIRTTITASANIAAYVWCVVIGAAEVSVSLRSNNGANVIDSGTLTATDSNGISDKSYVNDTFTWYRVPLSGAASAHTNAEIRLTCNTAGAQLFFVDAAYLQEGTLTVPDAFASCSDIQNRYDPVTANPERINYVDVWGVLGDSDAAVDILFNGASTEDTLMVSKLTDAIFDAVDVAHWHESSSMILTLTTGSQSAPSDANRSGGSYLRYTAAASPAVGQLEIYPAVGSSEYLKFWSLPHRVFLIARSSNVNTTFDWLSSVGIVTTKGATAGFNAANTWEIVDIGYTLPIDRAVYDNFGGSAVAALLIGITPGTGSATTDIDGALILTAVQDGFMLVTNVNNFPDIRILGSLEMVVSDSAFANAPGVAGGIWTISPGEKMTRYVFSMFDGTTQVHDLTDTATVSFTIHPRTRHLLGTS